MHQTARAIVSPSVPARMIRLRRPLEAVTTFSTKSFKGTPSARQASSPRRGSKHGRGITGEGSEETAGLPPLDCEGAGAPAAGGRQPGPLPLALPRTGAGRCRNAVCPAPAGWRSPPSRTLGWPRLHERPGGPPAPGILSPRKLPVKGAPYGRVPPLRSGQTLDRELPRQDRRLSGGRRSAEAL
jgi:hypothetical protein